jgi:hypothetical protein
MRANFFVYDQAIKIPEISGKWANFSIYEPLTKIPENARKCVQNMSK